VRLRWSARALRDLEQIGAYIAADDAVAAARWIERLNARAMAAARVPGTGRVIPSYRRNDIREVWLKNYRIVYRIVSGTVEVLTVREGHQRLPPARQLLPT
jgi:toxin ParE1/3/4